jgi:hypothetical protein
MAGCGSSTKQGSATTSPTVASRALSFVKCMRAHGVPNLPDPGQSVSGPYNSIAGIAIPSSINPQSPAFLSADKSCQGLISAILSPQGKPPITASEKAALIAHAQCMRDHGVPNYPDPAFPTSGGIDVGEIGGPGENPQSPSFQQAEKTCGTGR